MKLSQLKGSVKPNKEGDGIDVSNKLRQDWNSYTEWLKSKNLRGHPSLDKNDLGGKMIDEYRKVNPETSVSREAIIPIQKEFQKYREWTLNELKNKRAMLVDKDTPTGRFVKEGENLDHYMKDLSIVDGYSGSKTTSHFFPTKYMDALNKDEMFKTEKVGFAKMGK